jgi:TusA-related sulfurtransferase
MMSQPPDCPGIRIVDALGARCPLPLVLFRKALRQSPAGSLVRILVDTEAEAADILRLVGRYGLPCRMETNPVDKSLAIQVQNLEHI